MVWKVNEMKRLMLMVLVLLAAGAGLAAYYRSSADDAPAFTTAVVTSGPVVERVQATGTLNAVTTVSVGTQVSGTISALYADFNSRVKKGQVLAQLEPSLFQAQVEQAQATVQRLEADVEKAGVDVEDANTKLRRAEQLSTDQLISATDLDAARTTSRQADAARKSAQAQLAQARAALNQAQVNMGHATITAPVDGIVVSRSVDVGQTVAATMQAPTLFQIAEDLKLMQVNASVDESDIGRVRPDQNVTFQVDAYPTETFSGTVRQVRLQPVVDQNVVSYVTVIDVPNPELKLKPGMTAAVSIEVARVDEALRVPNAALQFRPDATLAVSTQARNGSPRQQPAEARGQETFDARTHQRRQAVWVVAENGQLQRTPVQTSVSDGTTTAVVGSALREGTRIVTGVAAGKTTANASSSSPLLPRRPGAGNNRTAARSSQGAGQ